jgi:hypothetical protein
MLCFKEYVNCVYVGYKMVRFNMCVRLGKVQASSKTECSVFPLNHEPELCMYNRFLSDSAITIRCV